jgi:mRNA-degrading endonuclease toxin of MazEF toxin-antitoxin module
MRTTQNGKRNFSCEDFFTDLSNYKIRPILVIKEYKEEDVLFLPLTTNLDINGISITDDELETGAIYKPSVIVVPKIGVVHKSFLTKEIGLVKEEVFRKVMKEICSSFDCGKLY